MAYFARRRYRRWNSGSRYRIKRPHTRYRGRGFGPRVGRRRRSRRGGHKRTRIKLPRVSLLWEVNPTYRRKCTIRGVAPMLVIGRQADIGEHSSTYGTNIMNFCPEQRFFVGNNNTEWWWPWGKKIAIMAGGWSIGCFSLHILWQEHQYHKNRWSTSNCGFDLAKYRGTTIYLQQHEDIDYIFFWAAVPWV